jgi:uncharacterized protein (DUF849 family)
MQDFTLLATAIGLRATSVRVGFEDSIYSAPGEAARTNSELVTKVAELIHQLGYRVATPDEARTILHIHRKEVN